MAKFYIESGKFQQLVTAKDSYSAALWAMHLVMEQVIPVDDIDWVGEPEGAPLDYLDGMSLLGDVINVSEIGFGRNEAGCYETADTIAEWNGLIIALSKIDQKIHSLNPESN